MGNDDSNYFLGAVGIIFVGSMGIAGIISSYWDGKKDLAKIELEKEMAKNGYVLQERNVIGGPKPEKFYVINGKRAYLEIDGKPAEHMSEDK